MTKAKPKYGRILLKMSGEALAKPGEFGFDAETLNKVGAQIAEAAGTGTQIAVVIGGGNILRGRDVVSAGIERTSADTMAMLATVMNAIALQNVIEKAGTDTRIQSALQMPQVSESYIRRRAIRHLEKGRVVIFAGGIGQPYFTTDTAAVLRSLEIEADVLLKGTKVDGIYDSDPKENPQAKRYETISYTEAIEQRLGVMDATAFTMCRDNALPVVVFDVLQPHTLKQLLAGKPVGTTVTT